MQIYRFDRETAKAITQYDCHDVTLARVAREILNAHIGVMYIAPGGLVGYHQAIGDQLFMVMQGSGWVTSTDRRRTNIEAGWTAFWHDGEWHESGSEVGMTVVIIEAETIAPTL